MAILVTGGAGYIGSHTCVELLNAGFDIVVVDNFCNSHPVALDRVKEITGKSFVIYETDIRDSESMQIIFYNEQIDAVIHFAGLKAVGESVTNPILYYQNNVAGSITLFALMQKNSVFKLIFSSSATVYGDPVTVPILESFAVGATNPYGQSKLMVENILRDMAHADARWNTCLLRYFNPVGAHHSGLIGEDPQGIPNNLMPYISQVAVGKLKELSVFGGDYPTQDGTGVRDYIHVVDLAQGHVKALQALEQQSGIDAYNLGTGQGYSVLDMVHAFKRIIGKEIPYKIIGRREGDISVCFADASKAQEKLGWQAEKTLDDMVRDSWNWQSKNPEGYA